MWEFDARRKEVLLRLMGREVQLRALNPNLTISDLSVSLFP